MADSLNFKKSSGTGHYSLVYQVKSQENSVNDQNCAFSFPTPNWHNHYFFGQWSLKFSKHWPSLEENCYRAIIGNHDRDATTFFSDFLSGEVSGT